jgi:hypothetical protein
MTGDIRPQPLIASLMVNPPTIMHRVYYSAYHLWAAKHFCSLARDIENGIGDRPTFDIKHRTYVTNSVFSAVAFLESAINELFQDVEDGHDSYTTNIDFVIKRSMTEAWRLIEKQSILEKFQICLTLFRKPQFDRGKAPFQDASLVVRLRNELIHYKPKLLGGEVEHKLTSSLRSKFSENALMEGSGNPWFPDKCLGYGCAKWTVDSVSTFADQFFGLIGVEPNFRKSKSWPAP